jgi:hypothetical protein
MAVTVKPRESCRWDAAALGEVMLRLDPGEGRIRTARSFNVWEGGGSQWGAVPCRMDEKFPSFLTAFASSPMLA